MDQPKRAWSPSRHSIRFPIPPAAMFCPGLKSRSRMKPDQQLPAGSEGVIRYRTPQLIENLKVAGGDQIPSVRDGWFYPGDIGALTDEGVLRLSGRSSDVINRGGAKISGTRSRGNTAGWPGIKEAAACGVVGPSGQEEFWIAIVTDGAVEIDKVKEQLHQHSDIGIRPDQIFILDALPRGELGKVQKYRLKELLLSRAKAA